MHVAMVHEKVKPFACEQCGKMFGTKFLVREHMESHKVTDFLFVNNNNKNVYFNSNAIQLF